MGELGEGRSVPPGAEGRCDPGVVPEWAGSCVLVGVDEEAASALGVEVPHA